MATTKSEIKDDAVKADIAKSNGEVETTETPLKTVVVENAKVSDTKDTDAKDTKSNASEEVNAKSDEKADKKPTTNDAAKENTHDNEKNGDSLILTADEDLDPVVSSPKKTIVSESASSEATDSKPDPGEAAGDSAKTETSDASKAEAEKVIVPKNQRVIWVSNLSKTIKATDLKQHLSKAGKVSTAKIVTDGKHCFGYVQMDNAKDAAECIKTLNNTNFDGKQLSLSFDKPIKSGQPSKAESRPDSKRTAKDALQRSTDINKRPIKRRRSSSKTSTDKKLATDDTSKATEDKPRATDDTKVEDRRRERSRSRDRYIRERNERDRLKRRLADEERRNREAKIRRMQEEERHREKTLKLDNERRQLQMERELFEKQKREWARINEERRKLERERLEVEQCRVRLEEDLKKERMKRKSSEMMPSVASKISDLSKKGSKMMKRDDFKHPYNMSAPPAPKLGMDFDLSGRHMPDERKMGHSVGSRKMEVVDRKYYGESTDRKKQYGRKPEYEESKPYMKRYSGTHEDDHRGQWTPPVVGYGSGVGSAAPRYQDSAPSQQFSTGPASRASGYYYHPSSSNQEFSRYDQVPTRKY